MKKAFLALLLLGSSSYGAFVANLDAGKLRGGVTGSTALSSDSTTNSNGGSLLLLVAAGGDSAFSNALSLGQYVSGNDILLAAGGFNMNGGTDETLTTFNSTLNATANDLVALRWFPSITYAQYKAGIVPSGGQMFGTYNPRTSNPANATATNPDAPDGKSSWLVPAAGTINLNFFTTNSDFGGTQLAAEGYASSTVTNVPEPSTWIILTLGMAMLLGLWFRANNRLLTLS